MDPKWGYCEKSCFLERGVSHDNLPCCGAPEPEPVKPTPRPTARPTARPTPKAVDPISPKMPECKNDEVPLWIKGSPQWTTYPHGHDRSLAASGGSYSFKANFTITDLCAVVPHDAKHGHRLLHGEKGVEIDDGEVDWSSSQSNKIALPYCVPKTRIKICFCYLTGPFWVDGHGYLNDLDGPPHGSPKDMCESMDDYKCYETGPECPHDYY